MQNQTKRLYRKIASLTISMILLVALLMVVAIYQSVVNFEDSGLEAAIRIKLDKPHGLIVRSELAQITHLDAGGYNITSLDGIEQLYRLEVLNLEDNQVKDLTPLQNLNRLIDLSLRNNGIIDLEAINFPALLNLPLRRLSLRHNVLRVADNEQIRLSDLSLLSPLISLEFLELRDNHIGDVSPLNEMSNLQILDLRENLISDITPLKNLTSLRELNIRENEIKDLTPLSDLDNLIYLNIHSNTNLESLEAIADIVSLQTLILPNVPVGDQIRFLQNMTNLRRLNIRNCDIKDMSVILDLMAAGALQDQLDDSGIKTSIDIRNNPIDWISNEAYEKAHKYWTTISNRRPFSVPAIDELGPPIFSQQGGFYTTNLELTITHPDPEAVIIYTKDGSEPNLQRVNSEFDYRQTYIYKEPIQIYSRVGEPNVFSEIKTTEFVYEWLPQWVPPLGEVFKATVIRAKAVKNNSISTNIHTATYFIDEEIESRYTTLPVVSLVGDYRDLFDPETGIYVPGINPQGIEDQNSFKNWRKPAHIEFFDINRKNGFRGFYEIRTQGYTSRSSPQKGLHVTARTDLGDSLIHYPIFKNRPVRASLTTDFKRFIIRAWGSARSWPVFFADAYNQMLAVRTDLDIQAYRPAIVFVNGEYWGLHELREANKNSWHYMFCCGIDKNDPGLDIIYAQSGGANEGNVDHWNTLWSFVRTNDMANDQAFEIISGMMDIQNFIEYIIHCTYTGKRDWPFQNEAKWRPSTVNGKWRWIQFDMDQGFNSWSVPEFSMIEAVMDTNPHPLLVKLLDNEEFKRQFINTYADWMNSILSTQSELSLFDTMAFELEPFIEEFSHRWPIGYDWEKGLSYGKNLILRRRDLRIQQLKSHFELSDIDITVDVTNHGYGHVRVNTIEIRHTTPGIEECPYPWRGTYFIDNPIELEAIPLEGYRFVKWIVNKFELNGEVSNIFLTEPVIILNPSSGIRIKAVFEKDFTNSENN